MLTLISKSLSGIDGLTIDKLGPPEGSDDITIIAQKGALSIVERLRKAKATKECGIIVLTKGLHREFYRAGADECVSDEYTLPYAYQRLRAELDARKPLVRAGMSLDINGYLTIEDYTIKLSLRQARLIGYVMQADGIVPFSESARILSIADMEIFNLQQNCCPPKPPTTTTVRQLINTVSKKFKAVDLEFPIKRINEAADLQIEG